MPKNDCDRSAYFYYSRKENYFSQTDIAKRLCLSKMAISHWECGDSEPSIAQLKTLAALFDVSVDYLIGYVD